MEKATTDIYHERLRMDAHREWTVCLSAVVPVANDGQNLFGSATGDGQYRRLRTFGPRQRVSSRFKCRSHCGGGRDACRMKAMSGADKSEEMELNYLESRDIDIPEAKTGQ